MQVMMMHGGAMGGQPVSPHQMGQMASAQGYVAIPHLQMPAVLPPQPEYAVAHYHFCASPCSSPAGMLNKGPGSPTDHPQLAPAAHGIAAWLVPRPEGAGKRGGGGEGCGGRDARFN